MDATEGFDAASCRALLTSVIEDLDDDGLAEVLLHLLDREGAIAFRVDWDSGGPGAGAGSEIVYRLRDSFFGSSSSADGILGPYPTFEAALDAIGIPPEEQTSLIVNSAVESLSSTEWSPEELIQRLDLSTMDPKGSLYLNGEHWYLEELEREQQRLRAT